MQSLRKNLKRVSTSSLKLGALVSIILISFSEHIAFGDSAGQAACGTINSTSDYMTCLRSVNPVLAHRIDAAPGGAEGYFNKLSSMTGIPVSQWISNKNPPTPDQVMQILSKQVPQSQGWLSGLLQRFEQAVTGGANPLPQLATQNAEQLPNASSQDSVSPTIGSRIASMFGGPSSGNTTQQNSSLQQTPAINNRSATSIAEDPGVSLFHRVEMKYQEIAPRMIPSQGGQTLKDWGNK